MKNVLIAFSLLLPATCVLGQNMIVFYRLDAEQTGTAFEKGELKFADRSIANMPPNSVFIYKQMGKGKYSFSAGGYTEPDKMEPLMIRQTPTTATIAFVRVGIRAASNIRSLRIDDLDGFKAIYQRAWWLRANLARQGYDGLSKLIEDKKVYTKEVISREYLHADLTMADTIFYTQEDIETDRKYAARYTVIRSEKKTGYRVTSYSYPENVMLETGVVLHSGSMDFTGERRFFYKSGKLKQVTYYNEGVPDGKSTTWYDTSKKIVRMECTYKKGKLDGILKSYYPSGKLKREEKHVYMPDNFFSLKTYGPDSLQYGKCYNMKGAEIEFTPYVQYARPSFDMMSFLIENVSYPDKARDKNIEGRVKVNFTINEDGQAEQFSIAESVSTELDAEALRVLRKMPKWRPAQQDGEPISVWYTQPLTFTLE